MDTDFPRAILHIDGDAFFVSCELTRKPWLKNRPVVTGQERGMATAVNYTAKALGVVRGMRVRDIRRLHPEVIILPSDYTLYALYARRMYSIVRKYADIVEEYSVDECFADITGLSEKIGKPARLARMGVAGGSVEEIARTIQADLHASLGMTFSVGVGVNKVTAKVASKWNKPAGLTLIPRGKIRKFLKDLPIGKVWGIGSATTVRLRKLGLETALDLADKDRAWVAEHCDKPLAEIYEEFQGAFVKELESIRRDPHSIQHTRTFYPPTRDKAFLWSQISHHVEEACARLREQDLVAGRASFFLKTQSFEYMRTEVRLPESISEPEGVLNAMKPVFDKTFKSSLLYRAAGIGLYELGPEHAARQTLFGIPEEVKASRIIHRTIDKLTHRFGAHSVFLGSSHTALKAKRELTKEAKKKTFSLVFLGEVR